MRVNFKEQEWHSSGMRTGRALSVWGMCTWSGGCVPGPGGVPGLGGCTWSQGDVPGRGVPGPGRDVPGPRGVYLVLGEVPGPGGCLPGTPPGPDQVYPPPGTRPGTPPGPDQVHTPPPWTESQTPVKTLPWPNFVAAGKNFRLRFHSL